MPSITAFSLGRSFIRSVFKRLPEFKLVLSSESKQATTEYISKAHWSFNNASAVANPLIRSQHNTFIQVSSAIIKGISGRYAGISTQASLVSKAAMWRNAAMRGKGQPTLLLGFLGLAYTGNQSQSSSDVRQEEQYDKLHFLLQETLKAKSKSTSERTTVDESQSGYKLDEYKIGSRLGERSCNSAVYSAKCGNKEVAIKMLFNYHSTSQSSSLYQAFAKEHQVLSQEQCGNEWRQGSLTNLPPQDNIIRVIHSFADKVPNLPDALDSYPVALPPRLHTDGVGHNRTLFLVMPRYTRTLRQNVFEQDVTPRYSTLLLVQLLEGVAHMNRYGVAHRDLKSDNLLLDEDIPGCPKLVITDFGSCLADKHLGLKMPFVTYETDRGGNRTLMAPEVIKAIPGPDVTIDYSKSDAWAAGTLAYEIFGQDNPFYHHGMDSITYSENDLPQLQRAHPVVAKTVSLLLRRDVDERISAAQAATVLNMFLWAPLSWLVDTEVKYSEVARWLLARSLDALKLKVFYQNGETNCPVEYEILHNFLTSTSAQEIVEALGFFHDY